MFQRIKYLGKASKRRQTKYIGIKNCFQMTTFRTGYGTIEFEGQSNRISRKDAADFIRALRKAKELVDSKKAAA